MAEPEYYKATVTLTILSKKPIETFDDFHASVNGPDDAVTKFKSKVDKLTLNEVADILAK